MAKVIVKQDEQEPIAAEIMAQAIIEIDAATKKMLSAGLKFETIVALIHDRSNLPKRDIRIVLNNLTDMRKEYCTR